MCNILHLRQTKIWLRPELLFQLTKYGKDQVQLLDTIHSLTKKVQLTLFQSLVKDPNDTFVTILNMITFFDLYNPAQQLTNQFVYFYVPA